MKLTLVCLLCVVSVWSSPRFKRQMFGDMNLKTIPGIMQNAAAVKVHCDCLMSTPERAKETCDRMGHRLTEQFPRLVKKGDCPDVCTTEERKMIALVVETLRDKYADCWFRAVSHYNITSDELKGIEKFIDAAKKLA